MTYCRLIAPKWLKEQKNAIEGEFTEDQLIDYNSTGYNVYYWPNHPKEHKGGNIESKDIDVFNYVFVDCDFKDGTYEDIYAFLDVVNTSADLFPTRIVESGNGCHVYWRVSDLDVMSYLRFQRRLCRLYKTDQATSMICQLMRLPGFYNTKQEDNFKLCKILNEDDTIVYTSEQLDKLLPGITPEDEKFCQNHYNRAHNKNEQSGISGKLPPKFGELLRKNAEVKSLFAETAEDRSSNDYRLGHIMLANSFTREEAMNVLYNSAKAMQRAPIHRYSYADNIVSKIWTYEEAEDKKEVSISPTVRDILSKGDEVIKGTRFPCHKLIDDTEHGFRLGQVLGIIGGSGVGKTTLTLNCFLWFSANNPDYHHFFFSLEQPAGEIASRIKTICGDDDSLFDRIHIVSNYTDSGEYLHYSLKTIEEHVLMWEKETGKKIGTCVIDHIGVLSKETKNGENDGMIGVCKEMKSVAVRTNTMLLMLSQAPREKAGEGDLELDKSAAYGTVFFESFADYCLCLWQPLKRVYSEGAPTIMAIKFAKIRHKRQGVDVIQEGTRYQLFFDPKTERLRELTQDEDTSISFYMNRALNARKADKKTDLVPYQSRRLEEDGTTIDNDRNTSGH